MKEILIATLLLGCLIAATSAQRGLFEFHDSYGRCWRCLPGQACVRCNSIFVPFVSGPPSEWDRSCPTPTVQCATNPGVKFPHVDIGFYWICADEGVVVEAPCFCDHVFDMRQQACVKSEDLTSIGCTTYANTEPHDCASTDPQPPPSTLAPSDTTTVTTTAPNGPTVSTVPNESTTVSVPTAPNDPNNPTTATTTSPVTGPSIPTAPNDPNAPTTTSTTTTTKPGNGDTTTTTTYSPVTPPPPGDTTRTTEIGGPGASPQTTSTTDSSDSDTKTTPAPCVCVVWWPCWCNPCWNMPCHSCNGCVGMMG